MSLSSILNIALLLILTGCQREESPASQLLMGESGLLRDVLAIVSENYVNDVDTDKVVSGAINGALNTLDDFSNYYSMKDYKTLVELLEGKFGGIGAEIKLTKEGIEIIAPLDEGPAFKAGIMRGDLIITIDGMSVTKLSPIEILQKVHGVPGTFITLTLLRKGEELKDIKVKRDLIIDIPIKANLEGRIAYMRIHTFNTQTADNIKKATETLTKQLRSTFGGSTTFQGLIIDLRNNPGGTLDQAVLVTSLFLDKGAIVNVFGKDTGLNKTFYSKGPDMFKDIPIVVLINKGSASASEVFAGALRDHKRGILVGEKTYGKGSVQRIFDLGPKGAVKLTIAHFTTPEGHIIHGNGLDPDILVESNKPMVQGSMTSPLKEVKTPAIEPDYQKQRALDLLQGLAVLNKW
ncbi:MAG: S41 family peptidase [Alphaproteobacteria bacterium]|nr:S41 family peptidase [Alphaproteobacteria bacterium]